MRRLRVEYGLEFIFADFYDRLNDKGFVIYPGKVTNADCFRMGHIGRIDESDCRALLAAIRETVRELKLDLQPVRK